MRLPKLIRDLITSLGGKVNEVGRLPDGSGFATASFPLPEKHWLYEPNDRPPMPFRTGTDHPYRRELEDMVRDAAKYAVRGATMSGKDMDFDPDALLQNLIVGMFGYHTADGLFGDWEEKCDPDPVPPEYKWAAQPATAYTEAARYAETAVRVRSTASTSATKPGLCGTIAVRTGDRFTVRWDGDAFARSRTYGWSEVEVLPRDNDGVAANVEIDK